MKTKFQNQTRRSLVLLAVSALCCTSMAAAEKKDSAGKELDSKDKEFMMEAAKGGKMEVEMGKMAEQKGQSAEVKKFGKRMVTDHTKANKELMALAKKKGVDLEAKPEMEKMDDAKFDQEYMSMMVKDHEKDVKSFEKAAKDCKDADVKAFASKTLPTLKEHLKMAKETKAMVDKKKS